MVKSPVEVDREMSDFKFGVLSVLVVSLLINVTGMGHTMLVVLLAASVIGLVAQSQAAKGEEKILPRLGEWWRLQIEKYRKPPQEESTTVEGESDKKNVG